MVAIALLVWKGLKKSGNFSSVVGVKAENLKVVLEGYGKCGNVACLVVVDFRLVRILRQVCLRNFVREAVRK